MGDALPNSKPQAKPFFVVGDKHEFDPERWIAPENGYAGKEALPPPKRDPATHLKILIVGAGYAGLMAALECWRKGHEVVGILERSEGPNFSGDLIIIQPSAMNVMRHWPQMRHELEHDKVTVGTYYHRFDGEFIDGPVNPHFNAPEHVAARESQPGGFPYVGAVQIRQKFYRMLLRQVARLGFKVDYGKRVENYFEDEAAGLAGVVLADGSIRTAHLVIAADGSRSRSELLIAGDYAPVQSSGMTVYRTAFPAHLAFADEQVRKRWEGKNTYEFWMGNGMHIGLYFSPDMAAFGITPRDAFLAPDKVARESWDPDVDPEEVVDVLRRASVDGADGESDWHPVIEAFVRTAPRGSLIHWPLLWRDLRRDWSSKGGRVVQIGDAAHSTVPASAAGGTLALEDAITLASCLQLASLPGCSTPSGAGLGVPMGARVYNLLRYERASCTQKMAFVNSQALGHTTDWAAVRRSPEKVHVRYPKWLFLHDPESYAYEKYGHAFAHLVAGTGFHNTNIPPGHKFVHWNLEQIQKEMVAGKRVEDLLDGDWT